MSSNQYIHVRSMYMTVKVPGVPVNHSLDETIIMSAVPYSYRIAVIFRGYKFSRMDHYKGFRAFFFRGLSSSLLAHAHINMQLYLHTVSLESRPSL